MAKTNMFYRSTIWAMLRGESEDERGVKAGAMESSSTDRVMAFLI